eukprot:127485-Prorocentrum_minimum.AAC.1
MQYTPRMPLESSMAFSCLRTQYRHSPVDVTRGTRMVRAPLEALGHLRLRLYDLLVQVDDDALPSATPPPAGERLPAAARFPGCGRRRLFTGGQEGVRRGSGG